ncbi:MAG: hypothetical protein MUO33_04080 [Sedimentisphaerales bacterium]|nr:hypothetical protein [Sedimentisphaerales bacterium]
MIIPKESQNAVLKYLDVELMKITPAAKITEYVSKIDDVYEKRAILKECRWDFESFDYLLSVFVKTLANNSRFVKKVDCFKVVRLAIKRNFCGCQFPKEILDKLFYLFKEFHQLIPPSHYDIVSWLSVTLKDQVLNDEQVDWLIQNAATDETILNRLLRYPKWNKSIERWATQSLDSEVIEGRESELYGILIKNKIPDILKGKDSNLMAWGIYYSNNTDKTKEKLLLDVADKSNYRSVCEIAYRLNLPNVVTELIKKIDKA